MKTLQQRIEAEQTRQLDQKLEHKLKLYKDRTAALLAVSLHAAGFVILTAVDAAYRNYATEGQESLDRLTVGEARSLLAAGEFPAGSMGPKIEALADYADAIGRPGLVTSVEALPEALRGTAGTWVVPD